MTAHSSSAPSNTGTVSDSVGGTFSNDTAAPPDNTDTRTSAKANVNPNLNTSGGEGGDISAGYDNNVPTEQGEETGEGGGRKGLLGRVKEALKPKAGSIGRADNDDLTVSSAAAVKPEGWRYKQANKDLNRE